MTRVKVIATACVAAMVLAISVAAQDFNTNERTFLTFSNTVELPGVTLQPGTYLFRLADSPSNRHIVQVFSQDEKQVFATILAVPAERLEVTGDTVVTFRESNEGVTPAVQYWYYPGDRIGHEFVYPKDQAMKIAKRTGQRVLSTEGDVASAGSTVSSVSPEGQVSEWKHEGTATPAAENQSGAVAGTAGVSAEKQQETVAPQKETYNPQSETPPSESAAAASTSSSRYAGTSGQSATTKPAARELPRTSTALPLSGLLGLLSVGGAMALRRFRRY